MLTFTRVTNLRNIFCRILLKWSHSVLSKYFQPFTVFLILHLESNTNKHTCVCTRIQREKWSQTVFLSDCWGLEQLCEYEMSSLAKIEVWFKHHWSYKHTRAHTHPPRLRSSPRGYRMNSYAAAKFLGKWHATSKISPQSVPSGVTRLQLTSVIVA